MAQRLSDAGYKVSHTSVRNYEKATAPPSGYVAAICEMFGVRADWLVFGEPPKLRTTRKEGDVVTARLEAIGRIANGAVDDETVRALASPAPSDAEREAAIRESLPDDEDPDAQDPTGTDLE